MSANSDLVAACRICGGNKLIQIIDFGNIALTGVFEKNGNSVPLEPMILVRCDDCSYVQLAHTYRSEALYGESYGYESHLNKSMVDHLQQKASILERKYLDNSSNRIVVDIASNDGTFLSGFGSDDLIKIGIDPLIAVVSDYYPAGSHKITSFFNSKAYFDKFDKPARLVTSMSVLYDLDDPIAFAKEIFSVLEDSGIWHSEQSYLPTMVETMSYDTVCHEHSSYFSLHDLKRIFDASGFKILEASLNSVNGGSIAISAIKSTEPVKHDPFVKLLLDKEIADGYQDGSRLARFAEDAEKHRTQLWNLVNDYKKAGFVIKGLGASTKGNVLLQWLNLDTEIITSIGEVNPRKFGRRTPGTNIPIVDEKDVLSSDPKNTIILVLPWHFRDGMTRRAAEFLKDGGRLLYPLPDIQLVSS
jgi:hypothetical protein